MFGARIGVRIGGRVGVAIGGSIDEIGQDSSGASTTQTVTLTDSADPVITGSDAFSYTAQYTNTGSNAAMSVSVAITLDASLAYVSASGTGWSISQVGQVVTCTMASASPGAANPITVNVTTGATALTANSTVQATASNASTANGSQSTTVQLVSKDATSGIYCPASSTEWTNFIARKALGISAPSSVWLCQEASGNPADSIGTVTLTAAGTGLGYQASVSGWTRKALTTTDGGTGNFRGSTGPSTASVSILLLVYAAVTTTPGTTRTICGYGNNLEHRVLLTTGIDRAIDGVNTADGAATIVGASVKPFAYRYNKTASTALGVNANDKLALTFASQSSTAPSLGAGGGGSPAASYVYATLFSAAAAEMTDAQLKSLLQALGYIIIWI